MPDDFQSGEKYDFIAKDKLWYVYFRLIAKIPWPLLIYEKSLTRGELMLQLISKYLKKMVGSTSLLDKYFIFNLTSKLKLLPMSLISNAA